MGRTLGVVAASLTIGAAVMYGVSHLRVRVEIPGDEPPRSAAAPQFTEPGRLPERIVTGQAVAGTRSAGDAIRLVGATRQVATPDGDPQTPPNAQPPAGAAGQTTPPPQPAAAPPPAPPGAAAAAATDKPSPVQVTRIDETTPDGALSWPITAGKPDPVYPVTNKLNLTLNGAVAASDTLSIAVKGGGTLAVDDATGAFKFGNDRKTVVVDLTNAALATPAGGVLALTLAVTRNNGASTSDTTSLVLSVPLTVTGQQPVVVTQAADSPYLDPVNLAAAPTANLYGPYLRFRGQVFGPAAGLSFVAKFDPDAAPYDVDSAQQAPTSAAGQWDYRLTPRVYQTGQNGKIWVRAQFPNGHAYAAKAIAVTPQTFVDKLDKPAIQAVNYDDGKTAVPADPTQPAPDPMVYWANKAKFKITVKPPDNATVLLVAIDSDTYAQPGTALTDTTPKTIDVTVGTGASHTVKVAAARGSGAPGVVAQIRIMVRTTGPVVESVAAPGFGQSKGVGTEKIQVRFNPENKLDKDAAENAANYSVTRLVGVGTASGELVTGKPSFDPATNTVTLTVKEVIAGAYTVAIKKKKDTSPPGVSDVFGNALFVSPGVADANAYETTLSVGAADAPLPSVAAGVTLQTGPNVTFPEYTRFRRVPDGFNPSDRVETRVVRLYYNRDAHRVAQIVNRDVKSYNAATVDVRRRAADRARDDANAATDERMRLERAAVRANEDARQAEKALQTAQDQLAASRTRVTQANIMVSQRQDDLAVAQRDLQRAQIAAGPMNQNDAAVLAAKAQVVQLTNQLQVATLQKNDVEAAAAIDEQKAQADVATAQTRLRDAKVSLDQATRAFIVNQMMKPSPAFDDFQNAQARVNSEQNTLDQMKDRLTKVRMDRAQAQTSVTLLQQQLDQATTAQARAVAEAARLNQPDLLAEQNQQQVAEIQRQLAMARQVISNGAASEAQLQAAVTDAQQRVQAARLTEVQATEAWQAKEQVELRTREDLFRKEVAAAREDPDTYAPGKPNSDDPVRQCSISVVGEGLIQIRGPIKGLNVIRTMINQLDAPVGQVRVGIHTVQVNGERGDRMEKVVANIQRHIDHSRFLTAQSAQLLRKSVTLVASRKAEEAAAQIGPGCTQADRDVKYLLAFYGRDFINELRELDSEFLRTGNKVLSLNSMDSTSLSAALFQMALAKNSVRMEILNEFQAQLQQYLPDAEQTYYLAGLSGQKCEACLEKKFYFLGYNAKFMSLAGYFNGEVAGDDTLNPLQREFVRLAQIFKSRMITEVQLKQRVMERSLLEERLGNYLEELRKAKVLEDQAKEELSKVQQMVATERGKVFIPLNGLANVFAPINQNINQFESATPDILTYIKSNDSRISKLQTLEALDKFEAASKVEIARNEDEKARLNANYKVATDKFQEVEAQYHEAIEKSSRAVNPAATALIAAADVASQTKAEANKLQQELSSLQNVADSTKVQIEKLDRERNAISSVAKIAESRLATSRSQGQAPPFVKTVGSTNLITGADRDRYLSGIASLSAIVLTLDNFKFNEFQEQYGRIKNSMALLSAKENQTPEQIFVMLDRYRLTYQAVRQIVESVRQDFNRLVTQANPLFTDLANQAIEIKSIADRWNLLRANLLATADRIQGVTLRANLADGISKVDDAFRNLQQADFKAQIAKQAADKARRPLDEKKLLDMLVDETEDKFIELLEGTRAHTANVDNYIKSLSTALEDDFNTQFYLPSFRRVREASRYWDVTLGQIETTTILANNRAFAKVDPAATFEFDLPKRNIAITEGFQGAKALMTEYGALLTDPTFLSAAKMYSGQPVAALTGTGGGLSAVRNVLPGLPSSADELLMAQAGPGRKEFGSALEALIPDPAIYKFETGTGFEIRPVLSPDGQAVVFNFNYMYSTNVREPVRAGEKHLGRVKRHFVHTDVQLSNYELREVSKYLVALKVSRTGQGVQLLQDIPGLGVLFRPPPSAESSLQQNLIYAQTTIFPTLFDLMGLRYAPAVADLDPLADRNDEWVVRSRRRDLEQRIGDAGATRVDDALRIPYGERRPDLYRPQVSIPYVHPNGYSGPGLRLRDSVLQEGYDPTRSFPTSPFAPGNSTQAGPPAGYPYPADGMSAPGYPAPGYPAPPPGGVFYGPTPSFGPPSPAGTPSNSLPPGVPQSQVPMAPPAQGPVPTMPGTTTVTPAVPRGQPAQQPPAPLPPPAPLQGPPPVGGR